MAEYRLKADKTGPRSYKKELQMISYRGEGLSSDEGNVLIGENDVYYPKDYLASSATPVVVDSKSYLEEGFSFSNKFSKGTPAALPIEEQFKEETEVSKTLLGINRAETQQGLFDDVSSYGLDRKDWIVYNGYPDYRQGDHWERKNSPAGPHRPAVNYDYPEGSSIVLSSYPVPYTNPGNPVVGNRIRGIDAKPGPSWGRYLQSIIAMYIIEHMVNNFTPQEKINFQVEFLENKYPKKGGKFNRLYWDQIWLDIDQGRFEKNTNIPIIPQGTIFNMALASGSNTIDLDDFSTTILDSAEKKPSINYDDIFFATTRYTWQEPDEGHYRIKTNQDKDIWKEYWGVDFDTDVPQDLKDWEFKIWESDPPATSPEVKYKLPYFKITSKTPSNSLLFGSSWPKTYSDSTIPQTQGKIAEGNIIGGRESDYAVVTMTSSRAFRYQPGRISGFTYGVRVSEEGAGPGSVLEFGVENFTDGYFFRLKDGTDFSIVRRSTIPLGSSLFFIEAGYQEKEAYVNQVTGVVRYKDELTDSEVLDLEDEVKAKRQVKVFETVIQQNQMNGDGLNSQGDSGYVYNPDTVTMYKIEFGWYGAIGARFYVYIPTGNGDSRWVALHTLVIENNIEYPCLEDPFFFFKYRVYVDSPSRIRLPQFIEKYGASYYIDGGDEGTVTISSGKATNRTVEQVTSLSTEVPIYKWGTVLGVKPKQYIINTEGNEFFNKKEIFPVSASVTSTKPVEIKFVNQFGCQENGFTFQEGYKCELPESQRLRGLFQINRWQKTESTLIALGRSKDSYTPTISYVGEDADFDDSKGNLEDGSGNFIGWDAYQYGLYGAHLIGDGLYCAYVNPQKEGLKTNTGFSGSEITIARATRDSYTNSLPAISRNWQHSELLLRYPDGSYPLKLSRYRRDTTLVSSVPISTNEFYLLFTTKGAGRDTADISCEDSDFSTKCDGLKHFGDITIGIIWPKATTSSDNSSESYPDRIYSLNRAKEHEASFGIIDPNLDSTSLPSTTTSNDVYIAVDSTSGNYVVDKTIPNSASYRYYEGLPLNMFDRAVDGNTIKLNYAGWLITNANGLEKAEGGSGDFTEIDEQFPNIPGADGGECNAIYGRVGDVEEEATGSATDKNGNSKTDPTSGKPIYYLSSTSSWPSSLYTKSSGDPANETLLIERVSDKATITVITTGATQEVLTPSGSSVKLFLLPVIVDGAASFAGFVNEEILVKYKAISLYAPSLIKKDDRLIERKIVGQNVFPLKWFISMREGAEIGAISIGQVTPNGVIQTPFSPHGSTLSVNHYTNSTNDRHNGGSNDTSTSAIKSIKTFVEADALDTSNGFDFSYLDVSQGTDNEVSKVKKCTSFISNTLLSGTGISAVGDYPIRWLKFKDSGDPIGSFYVSANTPTEISLKSLFNVSGESIGPSFWGNKSLFAIVKSLEEAGGDGKISITLNYKEQ